MRKRLVRLCVPRSVGATYSQPLGCFEIGHIINTKPPSPVTSHRQQSQQADSGDFRWPRSGASERSGVTSRCRIRVHERECFATGTATMSMCDMIDFRANGSVSSASNCCSEFSSLPPSPNAMDGARMSVGISAAKCLANEHHSCRVREETGRKQFCFYSILSQKDYKLLMIIICNYMPFT